MTNSSSQSRNALVIGLPMAQRQALRRVLAGEGFQRILLAQDKAEAAAILASELVEVVFAPESGVDYRFPDVFAMLKGRSPNGRTPVVLVHEGKARPGIVSAIKAGAAGVISVPPDRRALRELLGRLTGDPSGAANPTDSSAGLA